MPKKTVAVFFGGRSNEREISVITGIFAMNLLRGAGYGVVPVLLLPDGGLATAKKLKTVADFKALSPKTLFPVRLEGSTLVGRREKTVAAFDCALNCCHGGPGEDGTLAALLRWNGVRSASPDPPISAVFMDKALSKVAARGLGLPVARGYSVGDGRWETEKEAVLSEAEGFLSEVGKVIVKPAKLGSSIGIRVASTKKELEEAFSLCFRLDTSALVEEYFTGKRDLNCAACRLGGEVRLSPVEEVFSDETILTFSEKYMGEGTRKSTIPAKIPEAAAEEIVRGTRLLYETFGGRGIVRADFLLVGEKVVFNELNTVPGSLALYLFGGSLSGCRAFLVSLVEEGMKEEEKAQELITSGILEKPFFAGTKGKMR